MLKEDNSLQFLPTFSSCDYRLENTVLLMTTYTASYIFEVKQFRFNFRGYLMNIFRAYVQLYLLIEEDYFLTCIDFNFCIVCDP